jgi:hypothetical protein
MRRSTALAVSVPSARAAARADKTSVQARVQVAARADEASMQAAVRAVTR